MAVQWCQGGAGISFSKWVLDLNPLTSWSLLCAICVLSLCLPVSLGMLAASHS